MDNADLLTSHEIIEDSGTPEQASAFEELIENLETADYVALNDQLNAGVPPDSDWRDYWDAFAKYEWYEFAHAYHEVMGQEMRLD
jgi:hypothetical protein